MINLIICAAASVLGLPFAWMMAVACQAIAAKQIRRLSPQLTQDEALSLGGMFTTTVAIYTIVILCTFLALN